MEQECTPNQSYKDGNKAGFIRGVNWMEYLLTTDRRISGRIRAIVRRAKKDLLHSYGWDK